MLFTFMVCLIDIVLTVCCGLIDLGLIVVVIFRCNVILYRFC